MSKKILQRKEDNSFSTSIADASFNGFNTLNAWLLSFRSNKARRFPLSSGEDVFRLFDGNTVANDDSAAIRCYDDLSSLCL